MKYLSVDTETTSLDPWKGQILSIGAVVEDTTEDTPVEELPSFHCLVEHEEITGSPYALDLNSEILSRIVNGEGKKPQAASNAFSHFFHEHFSNLHGRVTLAGKNFGKHDYWFLMSNLPGFKNLPVRHGFLDPGPMYARPEDEKVPNLKTCLQRAGIQKDVSHDALEDARDVVRVIRYHFDR